MFVRRKHMEFTQKRAYLSTSDFSYVIIYKVNKKKNRKCFDNTVEQITRQTVREYNKRFVNAVKKAV